MSVDSRRIACGTAKLLTSNSSYSNGSSTNSTATTTNKKKRPDLQQIASTQQQQQNNLFIATVPEPKYMRVSNLFRFEYFFYLLNFGRLSFVHIFKI